MCVGGGWTELVRLVYRRNRIWAISIKNRCGGGMRNRIGRVPFYLGWGKVPKQYHSETFYDVRFVRYLYKRVLVKIFLGGRGSEGGAGGTVCRN